MKQIEDIKRIAVFDFDGTLVDTPVSSDESKALYKKKTGQEWPSKGWWSKKESLDMTIFPMPLIKSVITDYRKEMESPETLVIMMTGRIPKVSKSVRKILDANELEFDEYFYNTGGSTLDFKIGIMEQLVEKYKNVESVAMWDDRLEHIPSFETWGKKLKEIDFKLTVVESGHH